MLHFDTKVCRFPFQPKSITKEFTNDFLPLWLNRSESFRSFRTPSAPNTRLAGKWSYPPHCWHVYLTYNTSTVAFCLYKSSLPSVCPDPRAKRRWLKPKWDFIFWMAVATVIGWSKTLSRPWPWPGRGGCREWKVESENYPQLLCVKCKR